MKFYVMHRMGNFKPAKHTKNQCKIEGHNIYSYKISLVFDPRQKLDKNKFLIDHHEIDKMVQTISLLGSCEEFQISIFNAIMRKCKRHGCEPIGYISTIRPEENSAAYLQYIYSKDKEAMNFISCIK